LGPDQFIGPDPNAAYSSTRFAASKELDDWLASHFRWAKNDMGYTFAGACPRCGHEVDKQFREDAIVPFRDAAGPQESVMRCNCSHPHEDGDANTGCGAWWGLAIQGLP
jgi:hypothetical protein